MKLLKNTTFLMLLIIIIVAAGCKKKPEKAVTPSSKSILKEKLQYKTDDPKGMLLAVREATGGLENLRQLKDVSFTYNYKSPDGKLDVSEERYIFKNETSWAKYSKHQVNFPPNIKGDIVQFYDGESASVYINNKKSEDPEAIGLSQFLRHANYFWFTMMFKFTDPGILSTYQGQKELVGQKYDILHVAYDPEITGKAENDTYILYINSETRIVESFYFSLPAFGIKEPVLHAQLTYTEIDGIKVVTKRVMTSPSSEGGRQPMVEQTLVNVKFDNGFTTEKLRTTL